MEFKDFGFDGEDTSRYQLKAFKAKNVDKTFALVALVAFMVSIAMLVSFLIGLFLSNNINIGLAIAAIVILFMSLFGFSYAIKIKKLPNVLLRQNGQYLEIAIKKEYKNIIFFDITKVVSKRIDGNQSDFMNFGKLTITTRSGEIYKIDFVDNVDVIAKILRNLIQKNSDIMNF